MYTKTLNLGANKVNAFSDEPIKKAAKYIVAGRVKCNVLAICYIFYLV